MFKFFTIFTGIIMTLVVIVAIVAMPWILILNLERIILVIVDIAFWWFIIAMNKL